MQVLIIEDEAIAAEKLTHILKKYDPAVTVLEAIDSVKNAVKWLNSNSSPDLIFLDIYLSDGISFEIFTQISLDVPIIFTTAYNEFAIQAFDLNSIAYLLKPIKSEDVARSLDKFKKLRQQRSPEKPADYAALVNLITQQKKRYKERFLVKVGQKIHSIPVEEVAYFYTESKIVFLVTHDNRRFPVDYYLDQLIDLLDPKEFMKINRQFVIRHSSIENMFPYSNSRIKVTLQPPVKKDIIISTEKSSDFKEWLDR